MFFDDSSIGAQPAETPIQGQALLPGAVRRWCVDSEYGRLTDVLMSPPPHLEIGPCNSVVGNALAQDLECFSETARRQHHILIRALQTEGVRCATVLADESMPDLTFTRDSTMMTPWGLLGLRPAAEHRRGEVAHVLGQARGWGISCLGMIGEGHVEGGDICLLRPGMIAIGWSGERTNKQGALALAHLFQTRGWKAILTHFDPFFLHLDSMFAMVDRNLAFACIEALDPSFIGQVRALGIEIVPVTPFEAQRLGGNVLSLGERRILSSADNSRVNIELASRGYHVIAVDISQFTQCGGGVRGLTMPLARERG